MSVFINACRLLSASPSLSQVGRGRLSLVAISFYVLSLLFGRFRLSEFTLAGPLGLPLGHQLGCEPQACFYKTKLRDDLTRSYVVTFISFLLTFFSPLVFEKNSSTHGSYTQLS